MRKKTILVVGGAGYIGSHVNMLLHRSGYKTIVLDNLSRGCRQAVVEGVFIQGDMADVGLLNRLFKEHSIDAVMHFAAHIDVGESVTHPLKYYINNVSHTSTLLETMRNHGVNVFIFSSSAAIFGIPHVAKITENHPCLPINPYGKSKLMIEMMLEDLHQAFGLKYCCLRYFNAAGGDPEGVIKYFERKESNLIPIVLKNLRDPKGCITINGTDYPTADGTCIRDYVHIMDLGRAHIAAMEQLFEGAPSNCYNLGNGQGFSVRQVLETAIKVTGKPLRIVEGSRRAGDPPVLIADSSKAAQQISWTPTYQLEEMITHAWRAMC